MTYIRLPLALVAVAAAGLGAQQSQAVTLADLIAPGASPIVQGDKTYSNFSYLSAKLDASQIVVTTADPEFGLIFTAGWTTTSDPIVDSVIGYDVTVTNPDFVITGVGLKFGGITTTGGGIANVGETVTDLVNPSAGPYNLSVLAGSADSSANSNTDFVDLTPPTTKLHVVKDITVTTNAATPGSFAGVSFVSNTFVQAGGGTPPPVIPEPATLALIPLALVGLGLRKRLAR